MIAVVVLAVCCPIAGVMAYLITFEEYRRHFTDRRRARVEALRSAAFAFAVFAILGGAAALLLIRFAR